MFQTEEVRRSEYFLYLCQERFVVKKVSHKGTTIQSQFSSLGFRKSPDLVNSVLLYS